MNIDCYPLAFDNNAPEPKEIISELLKQLMIPIRIIRKGSDDYDELIQYNTIQDVQYFIIVLVYLQKFEA